MLVELSNGTRQEDSEELVQLRIDAMRESLERIGRFDAQRARARFVGAHRGGARPTVGRGRGCGEPLRACHCRAGAGHSRARS